MSSENIAVQAAKSWLELVDSKKYAESWDKSAKYFQATISKEQWCSSLSALRNPLGQKLSRNVQSKQYQTSLPGVPDGEYVVIQFNTSFQYKSSAVETVTPMKDVSGKWSVSGYYIK
ncbi:MAG: DUF4019 domain-containing protein [Pleurocapsa sp. SU_5_0]|nr:DUF4019 domain-containing protein [Pleurocapsa sp. SU_5_0]NJO97887.1 DUF4019 domain-containing protein [Pleurocapsa sp. CRU_1_2]NJR44555.1 DUF4019 domain-containing protein [Hyellaceae cyanobacterium CSU_1_1]